MMEKNERISTINRLETRIESLVEDQSTQSEELEGSLVIQEIEIIFSDQEEPHLSELVLHEFRTVLENQLDSVRDKNIEAVAQSEDILVKAVENLTISAQGKRYRFKVERLFFFQQHYA